MRAYLGSYLGSCLGSYLGVYRSFSRLSRPYHGCRRTCPHYRMVQCCTCCSRPSRSCWDCTRGRCAAVAVVLVVVVVVAVVVVLLLPLLLWSDLRLAVLILCCCGAATCPPLPTPCHDDRSASRRHLGDLRREFAEFAEVARARGGAANCCDY